ncbi:MAG: putative quinol monooxygenase [Rhodoglobus sp.]
MPQPAVIVTAVFRPNPGAREPLLSALERLIPLVHDEAGCLLYAINEQSDGTIVMIEKWESAELLDAHGAGPAVSEFGATIAGLLAGPVVVERLAPLPIGDPAKGAL